MYSYRLTAQRTGVAACDVVRRPSPRLGATRWEKEGGRSGSRVDRPRPAGGRAGAWGKTWPRHRLAGLGLPPLSAAASFLPRGEEKKRRPENDGFPRFGRAASRARRGDARVGGSLPSRARWEWDTKPVAGVVVLEWSGLGLDGGMRPPALCALHLPPRWSGVDVMCVLLARCMVGVART